MQYADGENLDEIITNTGRVAVADAVAIGIEVLRALEYAHERNVIHRDIKPSNIVIRGDSAVKVMDFGIAKIVGGSKLTQTGQTMGTVRYMSPEQVRGKQVDHRSDIYSLGVTLYAATCGRTPFESDNHFEIMRAHLSEPPPPPSQFAPMPSELEHVLLTAMAKRADARYQTAAACRKALEQVPVDRAARRITRSVPMAGAASATATPRSKRPRTRALPVVVAALLLIGAGGAVLWALLGEPPRRAVRADAGTTARADARPSSAPRVWPEPHAVARARTWKLDRRYADVQLRVLAPGEQDPEALREVYRRAQHAYRAYLSDEGMSFDFPIGPLNLAVVPQALLNDARLWPQTKPNVDYPTRYLAPSATLYVHDGPNMAQTDLVFGLGLHFCALISQLSNDRCMELAEGFEARFSRDRPR
jgi:hypothetical protein